MLPNSKRVYYEVVDRFYNIYYLLRLSHRSRGRLERLLQFLQDLFGVAGMRPLYGTALSELCEGTAEKAEKERGDLTDVLARQGRWEESPTHLAEAASEPVLAGRELAKSLIDALAAGHASRVKEIMANTTLAESMEPLWHATCAELGEEVQLLPAEVADAVAAVRTEVETIRARNSPAGRIVSNLGGSEANT